MPSSGKSLLANAISAFFPEDKVAALSIHELGNEFAASELDNVAVCIAPDMPGTPLKEEAVGRIKALSGNDLIQVNQKYKRYKKLRFTGTFIMCSNHILTTKVADPAFDSRIVTLPFLVSIPPTEQDTNLLSKFQAERDFVATCAINAYFRLRDNHYCFPGNFEMNMPDAIGPNSENMIGKVIDFTVNNFVADPNGSIYTAEAWAKFRQLSGIDIDLATFGSYFKDAISIFSEVKSLRKRATNSKNPSRCYKGIAFRTQGGETHAL